MRNNIFIAVHEVYDEKKCRLCFNWSKQKNTANIYRVVGIMRVIVTVALSVISI